MLSLKHIVAVLAGVAIALSIGCSEKPSGPRFMAGVSPTPRIPSDLSLWKQVEIPEPPEIATIPLEDVPPLLFDMRWSPDDRRLAYITEGEDGATISIRDIETGATRQIVPGGHVHSLTTTWHPSGERLLVGTYDNAPTIPLSNIAEYAQALAEYDLASGEQRRQFTTEELGGFPSWAAYSPDGNRLLVTTERRSVPFPTRDIGAVMQAVAARRTSVIAEDGTVTTVASGRESPTIPEWSADGNGLIYTKSVSSKRRFLGRRLSSRRWKELVYRSVDVEKPTRTLDTLPRGFIQTSAYPDAGGLVRYWKSEDDEGGNVSQWELWDYQFSTDTPSMVIDLYALFTQLYDDPSWFVVSCDFPTNPDWCFASLIRGQSQPWSYWYVSLGSDRTVGRLPLDIESGQWFIFSPSGHRVAYVDDEPAIHILDLGAVLPRSGGGQAADD